jgi:hypothetical protein
LHDRSEGWAEKGVLAHPVDLEMHGEGHGHDIQEVPIAGMVGGNDDVAGILGQATSTFQPAGLR